MTRALAAGRRRIRWSYALLPALLFILVACGDDDTSRGEEIVAPAVDACSRVGNTGDLGPCEDSVSFARERCATLSGPVATRCATELDELTIAAQEAYYLHHGQCDAMTSDAARTACTLTAALVEPTATPTPLAAAVATEPPSSSNAGEGDSEETAPGSALAAALWACGIVDPRRDENACEDALEAAQALCDRLESRSARNDCERALDQFDSGGNSGNSGRGNGNGGGNGNNDD